MFDHNGIHFRHPENWVDASRLIIFLDSKSTLQVTEQKSTGISFPEFTAQYTEKSAKELRGINARHVITRERQHPHYPAEDSLFEFQSANSDGIWVQLHTVFQAESSFFVFVCTFPKASLHQVNAMLDDTFQSLQFGKITE